MTRSLFASHALLPSGWADDVRLEWDEHGRLTRVQTDAMAAPEDHRSRGPVIPGMPNLHSHAFQRGFGGLTEHGGGVDDTFWTWRTLMYRFASRVTPDQLEAIATYLYVEMLEAGYTSVCEFHYVHYDADGSAYDHPATLAHSILRAARRTGIGLTLLPVLYQTAGFDGRPAEGAQRRFANSTSGFLSLVDAIRPACRSQGATLGLALHSLRAVPADSLLEAVSTITATDATAPIHIHVAEQVREVEECLAATGQRPVEWLLDHAPLDTRWCLVHATHMTPEEARRAAHLGVIAGLCPTTEANLGDGLFDLPDWLRASGRWGVGSDSHATVNAAEELQLLEYGQRLHGQRRNVAASDTHPSTATAMTLAAVAGGRQAGGETTSGLEPGAPADFVILDASDPLLAGLPADDMLAAHIFASHRRSAIAEVWTTGRCRTEGRRHALHDEAAQAFVKARSALLA